MALYGPLMDLDTVSIWTLEDRNLGNAWTSISALDDAPSWLWMGLNLGHGEAHSGTWMEFHFGFGWIAIWVSA